MKEDIHMLANAYEARHSCVIVLYILTNNTGTVYQERKGEEHTLFAFESLNDLRIKLRN